MENWKQNRTGRIAIAALTFFGCAGLLSVSLCAQTPANSSQQNQTPPGDSGPPPNPQKPKAGQDANPFPEDTNTVPVLPSANSPGTRAPDAVDYGTAPLPGDGDPVRSPEDAAPAGDDSGASSSSTGLDNLLKPPPEPSTNKKKEKLEEDNGMQHDSAKEDESVGSYYLDQKNWKAALSRFESAMVLDPENPDVYWGLAESQRHLNDFANAKANYLRVMEYDPDSKHGKDAKKILKEPEMESAKAISANARGGQPQH
jgi:tetratricopeptide (TPR) repeat protein